MKTGVPRKRICTKAEHRCDNLFRCENPNMNYTDTLAALNQASAFDLFRIRAAIDRVLDQPGWMTAVHARLRVGLAVEYFDPQANRAFKGQLLEMRRKQAVVLDLETQKRWLIIGSVAKAIGRSPDCRTYRFQRR